MRQIHPTAIVHPQVRLGDGVKIGPYCVISSPQVILDEGVILKAHVHIDGAVHIKKHTKIYPFVSIGSPPQNLVFEGDDNPIEIGEHCEIREYVSINSSCGANEKTVVGDRCYIMAYCHIAHNCTVGSFVVMTNGATLAGYVQVGDHAVLGGLCAIHQKCRIGEYSMIGGGSMIGTDVPPFTLGSGYPIQLYGLNWVGLKRKGISHQSRKNLLKIYRITYQSGVSWTEAKLRIQEELGKDPYVQKWIDFCDHSKRGLTKPNVKKQRASSVLESSETPELAELR